MLIAILAATGLALTVNTGDSSANQDATWENLFVEGQTILNRRHSSQPPDKVQLSRAESAFLEAEILLLDSSSSYEMPNRAHSLILERLSQVQQALDQLELAIRSREKAAAYAKQADVRGE